MKKKIILISVVFIFSYFPIHFISKNYNLQFIALFLTTEQIQVIKKYFFPYIIIAEQQDKINELEQLISPLELETNFRSLPDVSLKKNEKIKLSNNYVMNKYKLLNGFYFGINKDNKGSGYIDFHEDNIIALSVRGVLVYGNNFDKSLKLNKLKIILMNLLTWNSLKKVTNFL